jgi:hypothetical protein
MFLFKRELVPVCLALLLSGLFLFTIDVTTTAAQQIHIQRRCTATSAAVLLYLPNNANVQCLQRDGGYTLAAKGTVCNFSLQKALVVPLKTGYTQYGSGYLEHGWCQYGSADGLAFTLIDLPFVRDPASCRAQAGVFVRSQPVKGTIVFQCLQQGSFYQIHNIEAVCNFTTKGLVTLEDAVRRTFSAGSTCFTVKKKEMQQYNSLLLTFGTTSKGVSIFRATSGLVAGDRPLFASPLHHS